MTQKFRIGRRIALATPHDRQPRIQVGATGQIVNTHGWLAWEVQFDGWPETVCVRPELMRCIPPEAPSVPAIRLRSRRALQGAV